MKLRNIKFTPATFMYTKQIFQYFTSYIPNYKCKDQSNTQQSACRMSL